MAAEAGPWLSEPAPAKVNLYLHLTGQRADGYHQLESLAVFPDIGDRVHAEPSDRLSLTIDGPFAQGLSAGADNLILRAAAGFADHVGQGVGAALSLEKNLPVASGIGGGSSDAAATLRALSRLWGADIPPGLAETLGADVPVCLRAPQPTCMAGIGDVLWPGPDLPACWILLVNPRIAVETRAVFAATAEKSQPAPEDFPEEGFADFATLVIWLARQRNDLMPGAMALCPPIADVLAALARAPLARMSGSGATCFALYETEAAALAMAEALRADHPGWWVAAARVSRVDARSGRMRSVAPGEGPGQRR